MRVGPRLAALVTVTSIVAAAAATPANAADVGAACVRENLRSPAGSWNRIEVQAADPTGRFQIAWGTDTSFGDHLIRWDNDAPTDLGTPPGAMSDISSQGDIVGYLETDPDAYHYTAYRYSDGRVTLLPGLPDSVTTSARAIAPDGTVAGVAVSASGKWTAVTWAPDNTIHVLPTSAPTADSDTVDIDEDGTVIGHVAGAPVRWSPGATQPETLPAYHPGPNNSWDLTAIAGGTIIGTESPGTGSDLDTYMVVWAPGQPPVSYGKATPQAVNAQGAVIYSLPYENELWLRQNDADHALPFGPSPFPVGKVAALANTNTAYGTNFSTPVRWLCP
jgi:hypothetical protein